MIIQKVPNSNSNKVNKEKVLASFEAAVRLVTIPDSIKNSSNQGLFPLFLKIDEILFFDNVEAVAYKKLVKLTKELFLLEFEEKAELLNEFVIIIDEYVIQKTTDKEYDTAKVINRKTSKQGSHTVQGKWEKADERSVFLKLELLKKYKNWLDENKELLCLDTSVKTDWLINNQNIFGLPENYSLGFFTIQSNILNQIKGVTSLQDYLNYSIDLNQIVGLNQKNSIAKVLDLIFNDKSNYPSEENKQPVSLILMQLQLLLMEMLSEFSINNFLPLSYYIENQKEYSVNNESNNFENEIQNCIQLLKELEKPVYNTIGSGGTIDSSPSSFKSNLIESLNERLNYLKQLGVEKLEDTLNNTREANDVINSTIEDWLYEFKEQKILREPHYTNLLNALRFYIDNDEFPSQQEIIKVGRVNKKQLGWNINRILHSEGKGIDIKLLRFAKSNISTFEKVDFDENNMRKSNLYKYFTTKTE